MTPLYELGAFGHETSLIVAVVIGMAFGWFLERGGMGCAPKLAGQFYLTDLTVFKLMFSAIVTAMLGLFWLAELGLVEPALVRAPATFLVPQAVGGLVFGLGFVMGGLCPGTSCVAASSGRLDGLALMAGMLFGVIVFAEAHPLLGTFHDATARGVLTFPELLRVSPGVGAAVVTAVALVGFVVAERIEGRADRGPRSPHGRPRGLDAEVPGAGASA